MTTTNIQLRNWLARLPDDTPISVITTRECAGHWNSYIDDSHEELDLPDVTMQTLKGWEDFPNVCIDVEYDYDKELAVGIRSITLGKAHND